MEREEATAGIFITLEPPTRDMLQEAKAAGTFESFLSSQRFERIKIVSIEQVLQGDRSALPLIDVLKKAQWRGENKTEELMM
jgi:site-specific DNA-methyltransferase (adenine-specific)